MEGPWPWERRRTGRVVGEEELGMWGMVILTSRGRRREAEGRTMGLKERIGVEGGMGMVDAEAIFAWGVVCILVGFD